MNVHIDCRHFRRDVPCKPHKREGVHCERFKPDEVFAAVQRTIAG